jgi:hypothetical protein
MNMTAKDVTISVNGITAQFACAEFASFVTEMTDVSSLKRARWSRALQTQKVSVWTVPHSSPYGKFRTFVQGGALNGRSWHSHTEETARRRHSEAVEMCLRPPF